MNWKKRKKRNQIMKHYGLTSYKQYELYLRFRCVFQRYTERGWFKYEDRIMMAWHSVTNYKKKLQESLIRIRQV